MRFDLRQGFPLLTTKRLHVKSIIYELLWFLQGDTNVRTLQGHGVRIWDEWADADGELGPVYGSTVALVAPAPTGGRSTRSATSSQQIKRNPNSRRLIVSAWNVGEIAQMALPPCHALFQFYVSDGARLVPALPAVADVFLGVPFNIASYALLTLMMAQVCDLQPGEFVHTLGDAHLYLNHLEQAQLQLTRAPRPLPQMVVNPARRSIFDFQYEDFGLGGYDPHPSIRAEIAV